MRRIERIERALDNLVAQVNDRNRRIAHELGELCDRCVQFGDHFDKMLDTHEAMIGDILRWMNAREEQGPQRRSAIRVDGAANSDEPGYPLDAG